MNYYKHHIGDYDGATSHLSWDEDMAYSRLLRVYYRTEKPLPLDVSATFRLIRAVRPSEKKACSTVLFEFFQKTSEGWVNKRADEEIAKANEKAIKNREVGAKGGRPKITTMVSKNNHDGFVKDKIKSEVETLSTTPLLHYSNTPLPNIKENKTKEKKTKKPQEAQASCFELPDWVPVEAWNGWLEMRAKQRKKPTERAKVLAVHDLDKLRKKGHDPGQVLDQSTQNNWTGLFERRENNYEKNGSYSKGRGQRIVDKLDAIAREAYEREGGIAEHLDDSDI